MKKNMILTLLCSLLFPVAAMAASDTDVSQKANIIYVESATVAPGSDATITVKLKSSSLNVSAFQFDLYLPNGITMDGDESVAIRKGGMTTGQHQLSAAWMKNGACRVICYSLDNSKLKSKLGDAAVIDIKISGNLQPGTYPVILRNVEMARIDGKASTKFSKVQTSLIVQPEGSVPTDIEMAETEEGTTNDATYNLLGQKVKKLRRGQIGVRKGKKTIKK